MAITAKFNARKHLLTVNGDTLDNVIAVTTNAAGRILVNDGTVPIQGGAPKVSKTKLIKVLGSDGADVINTSGVARGANLSGGIGADVLVGGSRNDVVQGNDGDDVALMGAGNDVFVWNPGDDNDTIEGQDGTDTLAFNGANIAENIDIVANGGRVLFLRNVAAVTMDLNDVEHINFNALGGADNILIHDLAGTDVTQVTVDLAGTLGGSTGDNELDTVTAEGTNGTDAVVLSIQNGNLIADGLPAQVVVRHFEGTDILRINGLGGTDSFEFRGGNAVDQISVSPNGTMVRITRNAQPQFSVDTNSVEDIVISGNGGNDVITAVGNLAALVSLAIDGGSGNDSLIGGNGNDFLFGGVGRDNVQGAQGDDVAFLGAGNDVFFWKPGEGNDTIEGQDGTDTLVFTESAGDENADISANGGRVRLTRNVGNITMDLDGVEHISILALGGVDNVVVNDLSPTDVTQVFIDLASTFGGSAGDAAVDTVTVNANNTGNQIALARSGGTLFVNGLKAQVRVDHSEAANDVLVVNGLAGNDTFNASSLSFGIMAVDLDGGADDDTASFAGQKASVGVILQGALDATVTFGSFAVGTLRNIENVTGGSGNDTLGGDGLANVLRGGGGRDSLSGGLAADTFDFNSGTESKTGARRDEIQDFSGINGGELDRIDLAGIDAKAGAGNQAFKFIGASKFHHKAGELQVKYNDTTHIAIVSGDIDGNGGADFQIEVHSLTALVKDDFIL